jgi:hypothetical protein
MSDLALLAWDFCVSLAIVGGTLLAVWLVGLGVLSAIGSARLWWWRRRMGR